MKKNFLQKINLLHVHETTVFTGNLILGMLLYPVMLIILFIWFTLSILYALIIDITSYLWRISKKICRQVYESIVFSVNLILGKLMLFYPVMLIILFVWFTLSIPYALITDITSYLLRIFKKMFTKGVLYFLFLTIFPFLSLYILKELINVTKGSIYGYLFVIPYFLLLCIVLVDVASVLIYAVTYEENTNKWLDVSKRMAVTIEPVMQTLYSSIIIYYFIIWRIKDLGWILLITVAYIAFVVFISFQKKSKVDEQKIIKQLDSKIGRQVNSKEQFHVPIRYLILGFVYLECVSAVIQSITQSILFSTDVTTQQSIFLIYH